MQISENPKEAYKGIIDTVTGIFKPDGVILTGSTVGILDRHTTDFQTVRWGLYKPFDGSEGHYIRISSPRDIDLMVIRPEGSPVTQEYLDEKAASLEKNLSPDDRGLLDLAIADGTLMPILEVLGDLAVQYESAQTATDANALVEIRNQRTQVIGRYLTAAASMYSPLADPVFVNGNKLPSSQSLYGHTTAIADGLDYKVLSNPELSEKIAEASKKAYLPEELSETKTEQRAVKSLSSTEITRMSEPHRELFMMFARHIGFEKGEEQRNVKGLWDPNLSENDIEEMKDIFKKMAPELFRMLYG